MQTARADHWEKVFREKALDRVSWHEAVPETSLRRLRAAGMTPANSIADIGAGASHLVDALLAQGQAFVTVLDISQAALEAAWARLREAPGAGAVDWVVADVTRWEPARTYDFWHDRAAFHFLTDAAERAAYRDVMAQALRLGGIAVIGTFAKEGPERCSDLNVQRHDAVSLALAFGPRFALISDGLETHVTPGGAEQLFQFAAFRRVG